MDINEHRHTQNDRMWCSEVSALRKLDIYLKKDILEKISPFEKCGYMFLECRRGSSEFTPKSLPV